MPLEDFALVVGINNYAELKPLHGAEADSLDFYSWVIDPAGGNVKSTNAEHIISKPNQTGSIDAEPTKSTIEKFFRRIDVLANQNNKNGLGLAAGRRLWMFFSGHGFAPGFGRSALLVANTTDTALDNFASPLWAERLFQGGWFQEVLLFQDACRERFGTGELMPCFLKPRDLAGDALFYAMAAHDSKLSLEKPDAKNEIRGVFTLTLMEALRGHARDPVTGAITSDTLKAYLQNNMRAKYSPQELQDADLSQFPDVREDIRRAPPLVIVPAPASVPVVEKFPVEITLPAANLAAAVKNNTFQVVDQHNGSQIWNLELSLGLYKVTAGGGFEEIFEVAGALNADGTKVVVHVPK
jgi:hypothetical protein